MRMKKLPEIIYVENENGPRLGMSRESGLPILVVDGKKFKDHARDGELHPFEDWRLPAKERAEDLAGRLTKEQIIGLMMHAGKQSIPGQTVEFLGAYSTVDGVEFADSGAEAWELSDQQKKGIKEDFLRQFLMIEISDVRNAVRWNNNIQQECEKEPFAIPCNNSTNPRHAAGSIELFKGDSFCSVWPEMLGIACTFDPEIAKEYGHAAAVESRAMGMPTSLSPQIDLATDPRWSRFATTFGEVPDLAKDMSRAVCDGLQSTTDQTRQVEGAWGYDSMIAMPKHWPGGGTGEGGRDSHHIFGKYSVYPGDNLKNQMKIFTEGAFSLEDGTDCAAAIMPYYAISWNQDKKYGENVGNNYSRYMITDLLREEFGFQGVVCTDFSITEDEAEHIGERKGNCWGTEKLTIEERFLKLIEAGVDQFGDVMNPKPILKAYDMGVRKYGENVMRKRLESSAVRILTNMFRLGLFENPYLEEEKSVEKVGSKVLREKGLSAQRKSVVMLKNHNSVLPLKKGCRIYYPQREFLSKFTPFGDIPAHRGHAFSSQYIDPYAQTTDNPDEADCALVVMFNPIANDGYDVKDAETGGNGYVPISLQYGDYTAEYAREISIAGGDPLENFTNRSYRGKTVHTANAFEVEELIKVRQVMGKKPVIMLWQIDRPAVMKEFEPYCDGILMHFGLDPKVLIEAVFGVYEPSGLLAFQMPRDMKAVELQQEDVPLDMDCHIDADGHIYDYGYGLNWSGVISDTRTEKYGKGNVE